MNDENVNEETSQVEATETKEESSETENENRDPDLASGDGPEFKWYVVHALSQYEARVSKALKERILNHKMSEYFSEILIPEETVVTNVGGKKRNIKKKFFPGYVLIKMVMNEKTWHLVKNTDKITGFIGGTPENPQPISDDEAAYMLGQSQEGFKKPRSTASYSAGDSVKVIEGPFASFVGTVESVNANGKLKVNVSIFGRPTPVELDDTQVEKA
ncbi:MAG: transcription termination/antitermination protein NusG [Halobacteriovoraceae bacterium]|nr:transcription termination/antitermination protein NusG [Halobacteriovoraceae bacterium]|tara:strand:- start:2255 stop:2902 length:648 start_codon:yes stop_codon:yes gene_type:complete